MTCETDVLRYEVEAQLRAERQCREIETRRLESELARLRAEVDRLSWREEMPGWLPYASIAGAVGLGLSWLLWMLIPLHLLGLK